MPEPSPRIPRPVARATTLAAVTALVAAAGLPTALAASADATAVQRLSNSVPKVPADATKIADPAGDTPLDLSVTLALHDAEGAKALAAAVTDPASAQYHHYLATGEFAQRFGADAATVAKVTRALEDAGLKPGALQADRLTIPVHTTVAGAKKAFDIGMAGYRLADGTTGFQNTTAPALRGDIVGAVTAVAGLNSVAKLRPHHVTAPLKAATAGPAAAAPAQGGYSPRVASNYPQLCASVRDHLSTAYGVTDGQQYFSPDSLARVYGMSGLSDGGAGSTVAIFSLESYSADALASYQSCYGTNTAVQTVLVNAGTPAPADTKSVGFEAALDLDTVIGLAPKANVMFYQGPDGATSDQGLDVYRRIVTDNKADVVSSSWGSCDYLGAQAVVDAENQLFLQAAAQGQTVLAASGDDGSSDCKRATNVSDADRLHASADDPAAQPWVTGVGGTTIAGGVGSPSETVWNHGGNASGGAISLWSLRNSSNFQAGFTAPGFDNRFCQDATAAQSNTCRQVPDVSAVADPGTGYLITTGPALGDWQPMGGTSGAAPLWAALTAHVNASGKCSGRVGNLNQPLYQAARAGRSPLTDITSGNNDIGYQGGKFAAGPGYDMATGLGTPKGAQVVDALCPPAATYVPVPPKRILDTRNGTGRGQVGAMASVNLKVGGQGGVPTSGVSAVVLNTTVVDTASAGYLTAYPAGTQRPLSSNLNWTQGAVVPNLVTVPVSADGTVSLFNGSWGGSDFVADVAGYYTTAGGGSQLAPLAPKRLLDTRDHTGHGTVATKTGVSLQIAGAGGVPPTGATAAVLNVTAVDTASGGYLTVYPSGVDRPLASNLNWTTGQVVPNAVIVPIGSDGRIELYNGSWGSMDVVVDIAGYFSPTATGGKFHAVNPTRQIDTRQGHGALTNNQLLTVGLTAPNLRVPAEATSAVLNVTVTNTTSAGYLTAWAHGGDRPVASNLNWTAGRTVANQVTVPVHDGQVDMAAVCNTTDVVVDLFGYYSN
ncbi:S53 family peptidase [Kitasatospora sp. NPDC002227]|uniref:S53 family peptidase n=1 Tax=Kitasatospora sp. NPDC002227 TaxID=3154773 RepID=UPI00331DB14F